MTALVEPGENRGRDVGDCTRPRRRSFLVVYHADALTLASEPENRPQKVSAAGAVDPAAPKNQVRTSAALNCVFSSLLGAAIGVERVRRISLRVRSAPPIEHVIRRIVNEPRILLARRIRQHCRPLGVYA